MPGINYDGLGDFANTSGFRLKLKKEKSAVTNQLLHHVATAPFLNAAKLSREGYRKFHVKMDRKFETEKQESREEVFDVRNKNKPIGPSYMPPNLPYPSPFDGANFADDVEVTEGVYVSTNTFEGVGDVAYNPKSNTYLTGYINYDGSPEYAETQKPAILGKYDAQHYEILHNRSEAIKKFLCH